uniref:Uncharacterized protein n=1 Tax=Monodon monoceros TaxID=40151 RepID=A0A8C6BCY7_MONMO
GLYVKENGQPLKGPLGLPSPLPPGVDGGADGGGDHCGITRVGLCDTRAGKSQKWDESNFLATYRPAYRNCDFMKMNEPGAKSDFETKEAMTLDSLANKLATTDTSELNYPVREPKKDGAHTSKTFLDKPEKQRQFEMKRKLHCNQGLNIKLARQLISKDLQREEVEDENKENLSYPLHALFPQSSWGIHSTRLYGVS